MTDAQRGPVASAVKLELVVGDEVADGDVVAILE